MIEQIRKIRANLASQPLPDRELFDERHVDVMNAHEPDVGKARRIVAKREWSLRGGGKDGGVEPVINVLAGTGELGALMGERRGIREIHRESRLVSNIPSRFPISEHIHKGPGHIAAEPLAFAEGQFISPKNGDALGHIENTNSVVNGQPLLSFPNPFPASTANASIPSQTVVGYPLSTANGRIHQYSVTLERQIKNIGLRATYTGSRDIGLNYSINLDKPMPGLAPFTTALLPYPQYTSASYWRSNGRTKFNSLTIEGERKVGQLTFLAHWVWSASMDNFLNLENPYEALAWNRDAYPSENSAVISVSWQVPVGKGRTFLAHAPAAMNYLVGGWNLYWISTLESGHFFSPSYSGSDASHTNTSGGLPNRICDGNLPSDQRSIMHWFNASCFTAPAPGTFGNSGVNVLVGPGYAVQDVSISKSVPITERIRFTFTAAYSNLFNHPNFSTPASNVSAPGSVGVISSQFGTSYSRIGELRGRIDF